MLPLRHARFWRVADLALLLLVFASALMPATWLWKDHGGLAWLVGADKWLHALTFFVLLVWISGQYRRASYWRIAVGLMIFGILIEFCQSLVGYRSADWRDIAANTAGIIAGLVIAIAGFGGWCLRVEDWYSARMTGTGID